ncbi:MAG: NUDIX hydrolase [Lachnospiraceae bacterium]|nr:NUDIX hydrolase [Lachnospiraceae bacterium]
MNGVNATYDMTQEEKAFLEQYDITRYERPSLATDISIFSIMKEGENSNFRKLEKRALKILLIKRGSYPYKNAWALPGGFCRPDEDVYETARRELCEETNIKDVYLKPFGIFGEIGRDPRGWIISNAFLALMDSKNYKLRAGTDAWEAKWFTVELATKELKKDAGENSIYVETEYVLSFSNQEDETSFSAKVKEYKQFENYHETVRYEVLDNGNLAFDHGKIILQALLTLRKEVENDFRIAFDLMPELFTLTELQTAFEVILDQELLKANFRRKIADYVVETEKIIEGSGHRPAKLFKRNVEAFYKE